MTEYTQGESVSYIKNAILYIEKRINATIKKRMMKDKTLKDNQNCVRKWQKFFFHTEVWAVTDVIEGLKLLKCIFWDK
jgi:hypothetical protein